MKNKLTTMNDLTILIPVRLDTIERLENTLAVTQFLLSNFETNIRVAEFSSYNNGLLEKLLDKSIQYSFQEDPDPVLHRTRFLNQMARKVDTPLVAVWDTDVIVSVDQVEKAVEMLRTGEADFVIPYEKQALDTSPIVRRLFLEDGKIETLESCKKKMNEMYAPNPVGGAFLARMEAYREAGLENENFYGWGPEDHERYYRFEKLKYKIRHVSGPLFHLSHGRGINSTYHNDDQQLIKFKEINSVRINKSVDCI